jgi:hypothetical protein
LALIRRPLSTPQISATWPADWHRLLEICALADTLICDEDGLYDPTDFNDRLLLGMKGQLSEALSGSLIWGK